MRCNKPDLQQSASGGPSHPGAAAQKDPAKRGSEIAFAFLLAGLCAGLLANFAEIVAANRTLQLSLRAAAILVVVASSLTLSTRPMRSYHVLFALLPLVGLAALSTLWNSAPPAGLLRWLTILLCYAAMARIAWGVECHKAAGISLLLGLAIAGGIFSAYALKFTEQFGTLAAYQRAIPGVHPNHQAMICGATSVLALGLLFLYRNAKLRAILLATAVIAAAAMTMTGSRTAVAASLVGAGSFVVLRFDYRSVAKPILILSSIASLAVVGLLLCWDTLLPHLDRFLLARPIGTLSGRTEIWGYVIEGMFRPPIMPLGLGPGTGREFLVDLFSKQAHNGYLQMIVDLGPMAMVPLVLLFGTPLVRGLKAADRFPKQAALFLSVIVFILVHALTESDFDRLGNGAHLAFILSVVKLWQARHWQTPGDADPAAHPAAS